ncbi:ketosteroid isomerase-like protein [Albidovulum inexpectatum]|uniref:Ketosteroid isomerase-like protein n=1 Tax=Albidovulum inexpectatum TaxID=196587 RepID=A0A2S5JJZ5_9RHOB|nr:nuclear transport factor 2 family protein [Albidovulum inexpectatum]PPB81799.1 ketosteroid isomerase-like protein [Albidovulum inexpectatum]
MTLKDIADRLVDGCRTGKELENLGRLYHPDAISVEAADYSGEGREVRGIDGIKAKHEWWNSAFELHDAAVEGPFLHGDDRFAVIFTVDATERESGKRMKMREVAIYHVPDGKITREEFFGIG